MKSETLPITLLLLLKEHRASYLERIGAVASQFSQLLLLGDQEKKSVAQRLEHPHIDFIPVTRSAPLKDQMEPVQSKIQAPYTLLLVEDEMPDLEKLDANALDKSDSLIWEAEIVTGSSESFLTHRAVRLWGSSLANTYVGAWYLQPQLEGSPTGSFGIVRNSSFTQTDWQWKAQQLTPLENLLLLYEKLETDGQQVKDGEEHLDVLAKKDGATTALSASIAQARAWYYYRRQQFDKANQAINQALESSDQVYAPHVIRYMMAANYHHWEEAYNHLYHYLELLSQGTEARVDFGYTVKHVHHILGETCVQTGQYERAVIHIEEYYRLMKRDGKQIPRQILKQLLLLVIELEDFEKAETYFEPLFGNLLNKKLSKEEWKELEETLMLFTAKGWYGFVNSIYESMYEKNSEIPRLVRRWIAALIKDGKIDRAQKLINSHKSINF